MHKVHHFIQRIKSTELEAAVNVVPTQPYLGQTVTKKGSTMQSIHIARMASHLVKPKVAVFMKKIKCKKYLKAVWNPMMKDQQMQVRKLHEQQGSKPNTQQTIAEARITDHVAQLGIGSQCEEGDIKKKNQHGEGTEGILW